MKIVFLELDKIKLRDIFESKGIKVYDRETIEVRNQADLRRNKKSRLLSARPTSINAARICARSSFIDLLIIDSKNEKVFDNKQIKLMMNTGKGLEIRLSFPIDWNLIIKGIRIGRMTSAVITTCSSTIWEFISPYSTLKILNLMGLPKVEGITWMSNYPLLFH